MCEIMEEYWRERNYDMIQENAEQREQLAEQREQLAEQREQLAEQREQLAEQKEQLAEQKEQLAAVKAEAEAKDRNRVRNMSRNHIPPEQIADMLELPIIRVNEILNS